MFDGLRRAIGLVKVEEERGVITVSGVPADVISKDIARIWNTSRVNQYMFDYIGRSGFKFKSFFAIEIHFILNELLKHPKSYTNQRALRKIIEELETETWLSTIVRDAKLDFKWDRLKELTVNPLPHQQEFFEIYQSRVAAYQLRGYMLGAAPGSGKTLMGIMLSLLLDTEVTVVISPKRAVGEVWRATLQTRFKEPQRFTTSLDSQLDPGARWAVLHYETLTDAISWIDNCKAKRINVILDECHNLNDPKSNRTQAFVELCKDPRICSVLWMSGTPIKAIGNESIPFLTTIDERFTDDVRERFVKIFGKQASRAVEILANRIGLTTFKVAKQEIVTNEVVERTQNVKFQGAEEFTLDKIREEIRKFVEDRLSYYKANERKFHDEFWQLLDLYSKAIRDPEERKEFELYKRRVEHLNKRFDPVADKDVVVWCNRFEERCICPKLAGSDRKNFRHVRSIYKYVALKVRGEALGRILTKRRIECFIAIVPHAGLPELIDASEKKTLIFTSYVDVVNVTNDYLTKEGYKPLLVYGSTNSKLQQIMRTFREDPDANPMIATFDSLAEAVPVIEANTVVLLNTPFRDYEYQQATSRVNRLGQDSIVRIVTTLLDTGAKPNISTRSNEIMEWSRASVNAIMGLNGVDDSISVEEFSDFHLERAHDLVEIYEDLITDGEEPDASAVTNSLTAVKTVVPQLSKENFFFKEF